MNLTKDSLGLLRSLMGAPLCCLSALSRSGGPLRAAELSQATGYGRGSTGRALRRLRRLGLVRYEPRSFTYSLDQEALARALRRGAQGGASAGLLALLLEQEDPLEAEQRRLWDALTPREQQVLQLLAREEPGGVPLTNGQIAARLSISEHTVRDHIRNIREKFGAPSKTGLRRFFRAWKYLPDGERERPDGEA